MEFREGEKSMIEHVIKKIEEEKIITIVRGVAREKLIPLAQAMYDGGICFVECTYDTSGKIKDEEIAENIRMLAEHFDGKMYVGAGTVLTEKQVVLTKKAGGKFIISPDTTPDIIRKTKEEGLVSIPGAFTPSEIAAAKRAGADFIKVFPVDALGPKYIKDMMAPLSTCKLLAVGGINEKNMSEYYTAGAVGFGIGSGVVNKKSIEIGDFKTITGYAKSYSDAAKQLVKDV